MGAVALLALFSMAGALVIFSSDDDDAVNDTEDTTVEGAELDVTESGSFTGTDGNDTVSITSGVDDVTLDTGAGDDVVTGSDGFASDAINSTISTGAGDDFINLSLEFSTVAAGDGNDTVSVGGGGTDVYGGAGDDHITVSSGGVGMTAYGGDGNDTLQSGASSEPPFRSGNADNVTLFGGEGDDLIYLRGPSSSGTGFVEVGYGGAGDDTIVMSSVHPSEGTSYTEDGPIEASGGEGQDTFVIRTYDAILEDLDFLEDNGFDREISRDGIFTFELFEIEDFEPGVDVLSIEADAITDTGTLAAARLEETVNSRGDPLTELILTYENTAQQPVQVVVTLSDTTGVTWDDVEFVGEQTPILTPVA